jgi:hypothetical protein
MSALIQVKPPGRMQDCAWSLPEIKAGECWPATVDLRSTLERFEENET